MNAAWLPLADALERVAAVLRELAVRPEQPARSAAAPEPTWRERLWTCPPETRMGVHELAEALGVRRGWVYHHCAKTSRLPPIPHTKLDGVVAFTAGAVRDWVRANEITVVPGRTAPLVIERRSKAAP